MTSALKSLSLIGFLTPVLVAGADLTPLSVGIRTGFSATTLDHVFSQTELFGSWDLPAHTPWRCDTWEGGWFIQSRLIGSAGWLTGEGESGFVGTLGLSWIWGKKDFPMYLDMGCSPTLLSRDEFGLTDFGVPIQFTSYGGVYFKLGPRIDAGYRFQHMSNAHLHEENPGLNLHMLGLAYHF